jgi:hypothetical protein
VTSERIEGPTPAGGAYADLIRGDGEVVEIIEYDANGIPIARTYADVSAPKSHDD